MKTISVSVANYCLEIAKTTKKISAANCVETFSKSHDSLWTDWQTVIQSYTSGRHHVWFLWVWGSNSENSSTVSKLETVTSDEG